jgi:hypothetical protein
MLIIDDWRLETAASTLKKIASYMKEILEIKFTVYPRNDVDCRLKTAD